MGEKTTVYKIQKSLFRETYRLTHIRLSHIDTCMKKDRTFIGSLLNTCDCQLDKLRGLFLLMGFSEQLFSHPISAFQPVRC